MKGTENSLQVNLDAYDPELVGDLYSCFQLPRDDNADAKVLVLRKQLLGTTALRLTAVWKMLFLDLSDKRSINVASLGILPEGIAYI